MRDHLCWFFSRFNQKMSTQSGKHLLFFGQCLEKCQHTARPKCHEMSPTHPKVENPEGEDKTTPMGVFQRNEEPEDWNSPCLCPGHREQLEVPTISICKGIRLVLLAPDPQTIATSPNLDGWRLWMDQRRGVDTHTSEKGMLN